ncbi:uncharacterized protein LOC120356059 isoform X3 [Nilaparvata lugens]|uniref:uncharacterized protein LOC120356059 isoform X3 n=1 Tax=Nilaparvata lugens TaxID=108931 RepID=UPI00193E5A6A|nr:uncharacterized protein LOC120356059 isoform X3 [Nilaparvata lugens]
MLNLDAHRKGSQPDRLWKLMKWNKLFGQDTRKILLGRFCNHTSRYLRDLRLHCTSISAIGDKMLKQPCHWRYSNPQPAQRSHSSCFRPDCIFNYLKTI